MRRCGFPPLDVAQLITLKENVGKSFGEPHVAIQRNKFTMSGFFKLITEKIDKQLDIHDIWMMLNEYSYDNDIKLTVIILG